MRNTKWKAMVRLSAGMGALTLLVGGAYAWEKDISLAEVPKPVMEAAKARFQDAEMTGAAQEKDDDKPLVYEVSLKHKGQKIDMILTPEGEIVLFERRITTEDLPEAVTKTLGEKYPNATYKKVEEVVEMENKQEKLAFYEALLVTAEKKKREVKLTTDGKIVEEE